MSYRKRSEREVHQNLNISRSCIALSEHLGSAARECYPYAKEVHHKIRTLLMKVVVAVHFLSS